MARTVMVRAIFSSAWNGRTACLAQPNARAGSAVTIVRLTFRLTSETKRLQSCCQPRKIAKSTPAYRSWHTSLKDEITHTIVAARVERVQMGLYGDVRPVGAGVSELRIDHDPGWRVYFSETLDNSIILLLVGGNKASRKKDIKDAREMLAGLKARRDALAK